MIEFVCASVDTNFDVSFKVFVSMNNVYVVLPNALALVHRYSWFLFEYLEIMCEHSSHSKFVTNSILNEVRSVLYAAFSFR